MKRLLILIAALAVLPCKAEVRTDASVPPEDEKTFTSADWNWRPLRGGAEVGYAQIPLFDSMQSISVVRYPLKKVKTFLANDSAEAADSTSALALRHGGFAAINASYFNVKTLYPTTYTKDDGKLEGWTGERELFRVDGAVGIKRRHRLEIFKSDTLSYKRTFRGCREVLAGGPVLLEKGRDARASWPEDRFYGVRHPRTVIGCTADGWGYLIVIDGRFQEGIGATIPETLQICKWFGLYDAINLDGGGSSVLWTEEYGVISHPYDNRRFDNCGQRVVPNIIYLK